MKSDQDLGLGYSAVLSQIGRYADIESAFSSKKRAGDQAVDASPGHADLCRKNFD